MDLIIYTEVFAFSQNTIGSLICFSPVLSAANVVLEVLLDDVHDVERRNDEEMLSDGWVAEQRRNLNVEEQERGGRLEQIPTQDFKENNAVF